MQALSIDQIVGQVLGNYRIERFLGKGRLNAVYLGRNLASQRLDALTMYLVPAHFSVEENTRFLNRFRKESAAIIKLDHPHILPIYEYGEYANTPYLATPYVNQGSLADLLKRHGRYEHTELVPMLGQLISGITYAHNRGCIHGTLRPSNIVVRDQDSLQVAGFGLMHMLQLNGIEKSELPYAHLLTVAQTFLTSPEYVAPEVVQGQSIDARSDIYALGCIIFELLSGQPPFSGSDPLETARRHVTQDVPSLRALYPEIPIALTSVVNQALERDPAKRFQHVEDLKEAFIQASRGASPKSVQRGYHTEDERDWVETVQMAERLQETPADGYRMGNTNKWQLLPPIVTGQLPALQSPSTQGVSSTSSRITAQGTNNLRVGRKDNRGVSRPERYTDQQTLPPIVPDAGQQSYQNYQNMPGTPMMPPAGRDFQSSRVTPASPTLLPEVNNAFSASIQPSYAKETFIEPVLPRSAPAQSERVVAKENAAWSGNNNVLPGSDLAVNSMPGMHENASNLAQSYSWWSQPGTQSAKASDVQVQNAQSQTLPQQPQQPQNPSAQVSPPSSREPLFLRNSDTVSWMSEPVMPLDVNRNFGTSTRKSSKVNRRRAIAFLAAGGVVAAAGTVVALNLKHFTTPTNQAPTANTQTNKAKTEAKTNTKPVTKPVAQTNTHATQPPQQQKTQPKPTNGTQNTGTQNTGAPPKVGTVIGSTKQATNSVATFANPATNTPALLIHLADGTFVAYDQACTHQGVLVNYDPAKKLLVCPAHGAIFDPAKGGAVVQGPAQLPIPKVAVQVQANGTITTGV